MLRPLRWSITESNWVEHVSFHHFISLFSIITFKCFCYIHRNRDTPIVKLANRKMTTLQLLNHLLLFILPSFLFLVNSPIVCMCRQIFLGFAFSVTLSINISKSQKIFMIVGSKIRMSKSEILMTNASEWIIIIVVLIINSLFHLLSFTNDQVVIKTKYFDDVLTKESYCSNQLMIYSQLLMATVLSVCNGIQGFRARKLPSHFKETNHVIYSSFTSSVVFVATTAIYFTQQSPVNRSYIILVVTLIFNTTHFLLLYGYKLFIMVFRPHLNTKEVFDQKRLQKNGLAS